MVDRMSPAWIMLRYKCTRAGQSTLVVVFDGIEQDDTGHVGASCIEARADRIRNVILGTEQHRTTGFVGLRPSVGPGCATR